MMDLPLDIAVFSTIIENNYIYVDKTKFIYDLYRPGGKYFLSRPRRFGKSLLVSTMEELFKGNKSLFKDLYIYDKWDWNKKFSVIHLDLSDADSTSTENLKISLEYMISKIARGNDLSLSIRGVFKLMFNELIEELFNKTGKKVVVLIDEYDKPIIDNIEDYDIAEENRKILNNFFGVLKSNEKFIEFIFLTGVTKFSKTSIFSGLNNVTDITINPKFSDICGYSQNDLETCFSNHIARFSEKNKISSDELLDLIKEWYNGYSWDGENRLYNPYSILSLFNQGVFGNYWFETGTPTFLMDFIKNNKDLSVLFNPNPTISGDFPNFKLKNLDFTTLLLQTGYLTIKKIDIVVGEVPTFELAIPNREVNESLFTYIIKEYSNWENGNISVLANKFLKSILEIDNKSLQESLEILISSVPAILYGKIKEDIREANYHIWFLSWFRLMGFFVIAENPSSKGTVDIVLKKDKLIVICELKYNSTGSLEDLSFKAINQIKDKKYYAPYLDYDVILLGIALVNREIKSIIEPLKL